MTGEQKPGGLEVVAWASEWEGLNGKASALHADKHEACDNAKWMNGQVVSLTPAEPAEARIRELEADRALAWSDARKSAATAASANARATAAEAKLARAVEGLKTARGFHQMTHAHAAIDQTLAALQQGNTGQ